MPTFVHPRNAKVLIDEFDVTAWIRGHTAGNAVGLDDATTYGSSDKQYVTGWPEGTVTLEGLTSQDDDNWDEVSNTAFGTDATHVLTIGVDGLAVGKRVLMCASRHMQVEHGSPIDGIATLTAEVKSDDLLGSGHALHALTAETASGNSTNVDHGAATAFGGAGHLHVTAFTGTPTLTGKIQHSVDNSVWVDLITFTAATGKTSERIVVAGTVNRHVRGLWTIGGGAPNITFALAFARFFN